jgi:hypothetical protein
VAFWLISCDNALSPSDYSPSLNEGPRVLDEPPDPMGYWRIEGIIDAPLDWTPGYPYRVQIWMSGDEFTDQLIVPIQFTLLYTGPTSKRWSFETRGDEYWWGDIYHRFFIPDPTWWSDPEEEVYCHTCVQGYKLVQFGGGWSLVLADEDWSFNPYNPSSPGSDWKYYQPYLDDGLPGCDLYWAWDTVYLDLR